MADLYIIAGPNGAGKSTFSHLYVPGNVRVFDGDKLLALREKQYPDIDPGSLKEGVDAQFENDKQEAIRHRRDFAYETNFSSAAPLATAQEFRKQGYRINLIFLGLSSIQIAEGRVGTRVELGGHLVEKAEIAARFKEGMKNLQKHIRFFDRALLYSSEKSKRLEIPSRLLKIEKGVVVQKAAKLPTWAKKVVMDLGVKIEQTSQQQGKGKKR